MRWAIAACSLLAACQRTRVATPPTVVAHADESRGASGDTSRGGDASAPSDDVSVPDGAMLDDASAHSPGGHDSDAATAGVHFDPGWECRRFGNGRIEVPPAVDVPARPPNAVAGAVYGTMSLRSGGRLTREPVVTDGNVASRARISQSATRRRAVVTEDVDVPTGVVEMLFEDARGVGHGFWNGGTITLLRLGTPATETVELAPADLARPCTLPLTVGTRLVPIQADAFPFPRIRGVPPSVADARWTVGRDARGWCIARLEGRGPWGRISVEPAPQGFRGVMWFAQAINSVECGPAPLSDPPPRR